MSKQRLAGDPSARESRVGSRPVPAGLFEEDALSTARLASGPILGGWLDVSDAQRLDQ